MQLNDQVTQSYEALKRQVYREHILLLHPKSRFRALQIALLINDDNIRTFYYSLGPDDRDIESFVSSFLHRMSIQKETFGQHIAKVDKQNYSIDGEEPSDALLQAFIKELEDLHEGRYLLLLDEYDRSDNAEGIHRFIERLADQIPEQCYIVINSRTLPRLPWVSMVAKQQAALLLDDHVVQEDFYGVHTSDQYDLEVYALGPGRVIHKGEEINRWEGHLPRLLFFFALDKPMVTRAEICAAFWPNLPIDQAVNVFHVTKRRLHKALGFDVLVHQDSHYQVNPELNVYYDVLDFVETLMRGRDPENPKRFEAWKRAVDLYEGTFLQGHDEQWIVDRREAFRSGYVEALTSQADMWSEQERYDLALKLYQDAIEADYTRQDLHRELMRLYTQLGRRSEAVEHYKSLKKEFDRLEIVIEADTTSVYNQVMQ